MSALGQESPFRPGQPNVRFAPKAVIRRLVLAAAAEIGLTLQHHRCLVQSNPIRVWRARDQLEGKPGGLGPVLRPSCRSLDQAFSASSANEKSLRASGEIMPSWTRCLKLIDSLQ